MASLLNNTVKYWDHAIKVYRNIFNTLHLLTIRTVYEQYGSEGNIDFDWLLSINQLQKRIEPWLNLIPCAKWNDTVCLQADIDC